MDLIDSLLPTITDEEPSGPFIDDDDDLENEFMALESACRGKEEQFVGKESAAEGESADWRDVFKRAQELSAKTKDVRVLTYLVIGALGTHGLVGFAEAVALTQRTLEEYWAEVHPILDDASDDNPWRIMCLSEMGGSDVQQLLLRLPIVKSRMAGVFSLRDVKLAKGQIVPVEGAEEAVPELNLIAGAFTESDASELQANCTAVNVSLKSLASIEDQVRGSECSHAIVSWKEIQECLKNIQQIIKQLQPIEEKDK